MDRREGAEHLQNVTLLVLSSVVIPAYGGVYQWIAPGGTDSMSHRLAFSVAIWLWLTGTRRSKRMRGNTPAFTWAFCVAFSMWCVWNAAINDFASNRALGLLVLQFCCATALRDPKLHLSYHAIYVVAVALGLALVPQVWATAVVTLSGLCTLAAFSTVTALRREQLIATLAERETELGAARAELEARVEERTLALMISNRVLECEVGVRAAAERAASAANVAKSIFLANMSHELRTPLNAILGYTELLREDENICPEAHTDLDRIGNAAHHLRALIDDALDLARIEAGGMEIRWARVEVVSVVEEVVKTLGPLAAIARNRLLVALPAGPCELWTDRRRLFQVLTNLVGNALKFTAEGTVTVEVRHVDGHVRIEVHDTGIGISADDLGKLFEKFSMVDPTSTRRHGGTGLGLAISRELCTLMGGIVDVRSKLGSGSTFTMTFPLGGPPTEALVPERP